MTASEETLAAKILSLVCGVLALLIFAGAVLHSLVQWCLDR